ncbi:hypothetical protein EDB83DRAFT_2596557 [Lactarius deliciosus]|nr:hypothetical protein EDB83DRAFT_2596557 [Lactarius deliciosus]
MVQFEVQQIPRTGPKVRFKVQQKSRRTGRNRTSATLHQVSVGEEEGGAGREWQACPSSGLGCGVTLYMLALSLSSSPRLWAGGPWSAAPCLFLRRRPLTTLGRPPPTAVAESQRGEPRSDAFGTDAHVAGSISLWWSILTWHHYGCQVGEEEGGVGREWQAYSSSSPGRGAMVSVGVDSSSPGWRPLERCSMPLPPPSPSDDLRPPSSYRRHGVAEGCRLEKRKAGQGGSGRPVLHRVMAMERRSICSLRRRHRGRPLPTAIAESQWGEPRSDDIIVFGSPTSSGQPCGSAVRLVQNGITMDPDLHPAAANNGDSLSVPSVSRWIGKFIGNWYPNLMSVTTYMDIFSVLDVELSARYTWMPNIDSLDFVNDPVETGPYHNQDPQQIRRPNVGLYALTLAHKNQIYLEYENRLCGILDMLESLDATDGKESMEDRVLQELIRINRLKGLEWSGRRSKRGVNGATGQHRKLLCNETSPESDAPCYLHDDFGHEKWQKTCSLLSPFRLTVHTSRVRASPTCGEPLFETVIINAKAHTVPLCKYEVQDLKQWVGRLLSRPALEEHVWGIDISNPGGDGTVSSTTARTISRPPDAELEKWYEVIRVAGDLERLRDQLHGRDCARDTLWHICSDHNLRRAGNKLQLAMAIVDWRKDTPPDMIKLPTIHPADQRRHTVSTPFPASETDVESAREGSVTTDDSIANLRSISRKEIELYEHYISRYMASFKSLYKLAKVKPIHHAALHYGDVLRGFGPAHTHSAAFYERYIHSMQSKNHNMKLGELELTFMRSSIREANLKALLEDDSEVRSRVGDLVEVYKGILAEDARGTRLAHMIDVVHLTQKTADIAYDGNSLYESSLPDAILAAFRQFLHCKYPGLREEDAAEGSSTPVASPEAKVLDRFSLRGVQYSTASRRARDSHVFFRSPHTGSEMSKPEPGQITHIFLRPHVLAARCSVSPGQLHRPPVYISVRPYASLQPTPEPELGNIDQMYRRFGFAGGFLYRNNFAPHIIIEPSNIISHVAVTPLEIGGHRVVHILPMDRLMQTSLMHAQDEDLGDHTSQ